MDGGAHGVSPRVGSLLLGEGEVKQPSIGHRVVVARRGQVVAAGAGG